MVVRKYGNRNERSKRGQSLVEFALALPILLFILLGILEVAMWFHSYLAVQYASREAARFAVTGNPPMFISDGPGSCEELRQPGSGDPYSLPADYEQCRVDYIKNVGVNLANLGVLADSNQGDITKARYLGVFVRGAPAFGESAQDDHPGVARDRVEVRVVYNHPIINPFFSTLLPTIRVVGTTELINEPWIGGGADVPAVFAPPDPLPPLDSDGDGWSDVEERDVYGTIPSNPDSDGDSVIEGPGGDPDPLDPCVPNVCGS